jgi:hypothetical protein
MDVASKTSASNKGRTVASSLAEQDLERMRAMTIDTLSNYHGASDPTVGGVAYHVESRAEWLRDTSSAPQSCTADTTQANYIRISSTVTSNVVGKDIKPITLRGIVSPPVGSLSTTQGTLAVQVVDRNANPVQGMAVNLTGTKNLSDTTNDLGCAVFGFIPAGAGSAYTAKLNAVNWVDQDDNQLSSSSPTVAPGKVTLVQMTYDQAGSLSVNLRDSTGSAPTPTPVKLAVNNSKWTTPGTRYVAPPTATSLFPFATSPYTVYAGSCAAANPSTSPNTDTTPSAPILPGQAATGVTVYVPTIKVALQDPTTGTAKQGYVTAKANGTGCSGDNAGRTQTLSDGTLSLDLPFGAYTVCGEVAGKIKTVTVNNTARAGTSVNTIRPGTGSSSNGTCT